jgi:Ca-activated chloride channel homolog
MRFAKSIVSTKLAKKFVGKRTAVRRGTILVMTAVLMVVIMTMVAFSVDVAYMQLVRTELRIANDAAAKAGTLALSQSNGNANQAKAAAIQAAARNQVAGAPLLIRNSDIEVGRSVRQNNGTWQFQPNTTPYTALRVNGSRDTSSLSGPVNLFFGVFANTANFQPVGTATASELDQEVCLVVDRSHSMCFDLSGIDWVYPPGTPTSPHPIAYPPNAIGSRWAALRKSVDQFIDIIETAPMPPRVSLVTWSSEIGTNTTEFALTGQTEVEVFLDQDIDLDKKEVKGKTKKRSEKVMLGGTNMAAGIDSGRNVLTSSKVRPLAQKTMILMTDGQWNRGRDPIQAAYDAKNQGIVIHTIAFLTQSTNTMRQIAEITGGRYYDSDNAAELEQAFLDLALTLPIVLTE